MKRIAVIRAISWEVMQTALAALGVSLNPEADKVEGTISIGNSPPQETDQGVISTVCLHPDQVEYVEGLVPDMLVDWLDGETEEVEVTSVNPETGAVTTMTVEQPCAWPSYTVLGDGETTTIEAGRIQ